ncbi:hypothetical protein ACFX10_046632 [Malus domestica]
MFSQNYPSSHSSLCCGTRCGLMDECASQLREEDDGNQCYQHTHFRHPELEQNHEIDTSYGGNMSAFDEASTVITDDTWRGPASSPLSPSGSSCR